ncbi:hypothetical protein [Mastigocoleus sp. MO_188.B34]|uniref:hypothetical protein n=1 Tax=Mastigocoleus sp. MO_188.B34 TaxID=3036635 RepID=UPI002622C27C|nr:hypothetical protein [Mastigocoleus sp. MO_188.B34]
MQYLFEKRMVHIAMHEFAAAASSEPNPKFNEILAMPKLQKLSEKICEVVIPDGTGKIENINNPQ